uniref:hypothetical protein n=1 Tax=Acetatifactor sp. TaxID=1872090 RepID=UPI004055B0F2
MKRKSITALALALALVVTPFSSQFATIVTATSNNTVVTGTGNNTNTGDNAGSGTEDNTGSNTGNNTGSNTGNNSGNTTATGNNTYPGTSGGVRPGSGASGTISNVTSVNGNATITNSSVVSATVTTAQASFNAAVGLTADMIAQGQSVNIVIANSQCGELARAAVNNAAAALNASVAVILEIDVNIVAANGAVLNDVTELSAPIEFVISTPVIDGNPADYDFAVVRLHSDGEVTILPDLDQDPATITFATDRFSVYAVIYGEKGAFDAFRTAPAKDNVPKTGSESVFSFLMK